MTPDKSLMTPRFGILRRLWRLARRLVFWTLLIPALILLAYSWVPVPTTPYQVSEFWRLGDVSREWVSFEQVSPHLPRSVVAAEDANYCLHWGFDLDALRLAVSGGARRGASTISQQTVKNALFWQGRSWTRKALEAAYTPVAEALWSKQRLLEVYINIIEFDEGIFGVQAAARHYFDVDAADLSATQAARLAAILPNPKGRSASQPSDWVQRRARAIMDGAATIKRDGRASCFETAR